MEENDDKLCPPPLDNHAPWLVYTHGDVRNKRIQTFCNISPLPPNNKSYVKSIPHLWGNAILASFGEWLILRDFGDKKIFQLWNIVTSEQICLPELYAFDGDDEDEDEEQEEISGCVLLSCPDDHSNDNFALLLFCKTVVFYCRVRRGTTLRWVEKSIELEGETVEVENVVACNGILYGWTTQTDDTGSVLVTIEIADDDSNSLILKSLGLKQPDFGLCFHSPKVLNYLVESCGGLYMISIRIWQVDSMHISKVKVWELDLSRMSWVEVDSLGDRAFFLGLYSCTWCWGSSKLDSLGGGVERNCVYFVQEDDETLYSYSLQDDSFTFLLLCPNLQTPFYGPAWVMPRHQRLLAREVVGAHVMEKAVHILNQGTVFIEQKELTEQNEKQEELLCGLAQDIIALISRYLHFFDYLNFRASCKMFQSAVTPAQSRANNPFPLFMFSKKGNGLCELRDICRNDSYSITIPHSPAVPTAIEFSKDGWLVVCTGGTSLQYFNLFRRVRGEFPPCDYMHMFASVGLSTSPTSPDCFIVGIIDGWDYVMINFIQTLDESWQHHEFSHESIEFAPSHCSPIYHKEAFYFLDQIGYLGVFKLVQGQASWEVYDRPQTWDDVLDSCHLVECDKELLSVFIGRLGKWVQVFRFDNSNKNWVELKSLGNHILFIGPSSSFSAMAGDCKMANRIYLPRLMENDIVFYSLETERYHTVGN